MKKILIIEDDCVLGRMLENLMKKRQLPTIHTTSITTAKKIIKQGDISLVLSDLRLPDGDGVFRMADGGTLFLDEIGNLGYDVQVLLLRALQERKYRPIGSPKEFAMDVRIIAATNENLEKAIGEVWLNAGRILCLWRSSCWHKQRKNLTEK